jgi:hypothetical protein
MESNGGEGIEFYPITDFKYEKDFRMRVETAVFVRQVIRMYT